MDIYRLAELLRRHFYPVLFALVGGGFSYVQLHHPEVFGFLSEVGINPAFVMVLLAALYGLFTTKFNPIGGKDQAYFVDDRGTPLPPKPAEPSGDEADGPAPPM